MSDAEPASNVTGEREDRLAGVLLGTALGDALGLPAEGMGARAIARRFGNMDRFRLLGSTGFVSDDTEQSALVAQAIARHPSDVTKCRRDFQFALLGWFLRLPWGIGLATVRACLKIAAGLKRSGVSSAGNGAAMRAAVVGAAFSDDKARRLALGRAVATVTHTDPRAVDAALFVAEMTALLSRMPRGASLLDVWEGALSVVEEKTLHSALTQAARLAREEAPLDAAAARIGTSGFVMHSVPFAAWCLLRFGQDPLKAIRAAIVVGGDTDSNAAIVGGWVGALHGAGGLPQDLLARIHDGPFGPTHLRALARAVAKGPGSTMMVPRYSVLGAMVRNLALYPVILAHGFRRLLP